MGKGVLVLSGLGLLLALAGSVQAVGEQVYTHSFTPTPGGAASTAAIGDGEFLVAFNSVATAEENDNFLVRRYSGGALVATYDVGYIRSDLAAGTTYPTGMDVDPVTGNMYIVANSYSATGSPTDIAALTVVTSSGAPVFTNQTIPHMTGGIELDPAGDAWLGGNYSSAHISGTDGSTIQLRGGPNGYGSPPIAVDPGTGTVFYGGYDGVPWYWDPPSEDSTNLFSGYYPDAGLGSGVGQFSGAAIGGIVAQDGKVYIGDIGNNKVLIFAQADGSFIQELLAPQAGGIQDIDVDAAGNVYGMSDRDNVGMNVFTIVIDTDGDGVGDGEDLCPGTPPGTQVNADGCPDADGDGVADTDDLCPGTPPGTQVDADGCPDADGDGVPDTDDLCPETPPGTPVDADGCPISTEFTSVMAVSAAQWGDYNNDGYSDMFGGVNVYTNQGNGAFVHTTPLGRSRGSLGDFNNDGLLDAFDIVAGGGPVLHLNDGDETWTDSTHWFSYVSGDVPTNSNASTVVDLNGDGFLDTFMTGWWNEDSTGADIIYTSYTDGVSDPCWSRTWAYGPPWQQKGVTPCDFDEDGDQDLYVSGYWYNASSLWRNDGFNGSSGLTDVAAAYGASNGAGHTQGSCWADFNNDGHFDIFNANFAHLGNNPLHFVENQGEPGYNFTFKGQCGVTQVEPLSAGIPGDYDNDGYVDILITVSGGYSWQYIMLFKNNGDWTFSETTSAAGLGSQGPEDIGAWGDYNNDGYLDLIANGQLWRNPGGPNHWLKVKLLGGPHPDGLVNGSAIGAQLRIDVPGLGTLTRQVQGNTGQLGCQNDQVLHFGLGSYTGTVDLQIDWPNGYQETVYDVAVDQAITVDLAAAPVYHDLTTSVVAGAGAITPPSGPQLEDSTIDLTAYPDPGWQVKEWGGDAVTQPGADLTENTVVMDAAKTVTVEFEQIVIIPACWDYLTQCHGDTDGDGDVDTVDWPIFRDSFGYAYPTAEYHPCGDMDHDGDVDTVDWPAFRDNFGYASPADCTPGGAWPPSP